MITGLHVAPVRPASSSEVSLGFRGASLSRSFSSRALAGPQDAGIRKLE